MNLAGKEQPVTRKQGNGTAKKPPMKLRTRRTLIAYSFLFLPLLFFLCIRIYPTLYAFSLSFSKQNGSGFTLANYKKLIDDPVFWQSVWNTFLYVIITVPLQMAFGLTIALGIERVQRLRWLYRMIYFLPYITSIVAVSWVWRLLFDPNVGFLNEFIGFFGIPPQNWLSDPKEVLVCISIVMVWQTMGFSMLIFMAGIQAVPRHFYEAAQMDGAGRWKMFWKITFPLLNPSIVFLAVTGVIQALQTFTQIENLTGGSTGNAGGPLNSSISMVVYMYKNAFEDFNMQYASAVTVVLFLIIMSVTLIQIKIINRNIDY